MCIILLLFSEIYHDHYYFNQLCLSSERIDNSYSLSNHYLLSTELFGFEPRAEVIPLCNYGYLINDHDIFKFYAL